jgi:hypothetical protein
MRSLVVHWVLCGRGWFAQVLLGQPEDQRKGDRPTGHAAKITVVFFLQCVL